MDDVANAAKIFIECLWKGNSMAGGAQELGVGLSARKAEWATRSTVHMGTMFNEGQSIQEQKAVHKILSEFVGVPPDSDALGSYIGKVQHCCKCWGKSARMLAPLRKYQNTPLTIYKKIFQDTAALRSLSDLRVFACGTLVFAPLPVSEIVAGTRKLFVFVDASLISYGHTVMTFDVRSMEERGSISNKEKQLHQQIMSKYPELK